MSEKRTPLNENQLERTINYGAWGGKIKSAYHCQIEETQLECVEIHYYNMPKSQVWDKNSIDIILNGIKLEREQA